MLSLRFPRPSDVAFCCKWMHDELKMKGNSRGGPVQCRKCALTGCIIQLHLDSESFFLLGSSPSENDMGKGMSLTSGR